MKRVFEIDPLICPRCSAVMKIKSFVTARLSSPKSDPREIQRLLNNLGLPTAAAPPQLLVTIPEAA